MMRFPLLTASMIALLPSMAMASEGHGFDFGTHGLYIIDFVLLFAVLLWLVAPMLKKHLQARHEAVRTSIGEAKAAFDQAEARMRASEERLANLSAEVERLMAEFRKLGESERDTLAHEGAVLSEKLREETEFRVSQAAKMARAELTEVLVDRAFALVEARLASQSRGPVPDPLVDNLVKALGGGPAGQA